MLSISGALLTLIDSLAAVVVGLAAMALAMFTVVPACQLLIPRLARHDRGTATSLPPDRLLRRGRSGRVPAGVRARPGVGTLVAVCVASIAAALAASLALRGTLAR